MTDDRDPNLQALFASADKDLKGDAFASGVMAGTRRARRLRILVRIGATMVFLVCAWVLFPSLQSFVTLLVRGLTTPLFALENPLATQLFLPINSVAFPLAMAWLLLRRVRRRLRA